MQRLMSCPDMMRVLHVDVDVDGIANLEASALRRRRLGPQLVQVADATPTQTTVQHRARDMRVPELPHHSQEVIERDQKRLAQRHRHGLLGWRQGGLQLVRRVAAIFDAVAPAPLVDRLRRHTEALRQHRSDLIARLDRRPHLGRRGGLLVKMDQHARSPSRKSLKTDLAMKRADRRGEM